MSDDTLKSVIVTVQRSRENILGNIFKTIHLCLVYFCSDTEMFTVASLFPSLHRSPLGTGNLIGQIIPSTVDYSKCKQIKHHGLM